MEPEDDAWSPPKWITGQEQDDDVVSKAFRNCATQAVINARSRHDYCFRTCFDRITPELSHYVMADKGSVQLSTSGGTPSYTYDPTNPATSRAGCRRLHI